jgi:hypothetical protein
VQALSACLPTLGRRAAAVLEACRPEMLDLNLGRVLQRAGRGADVRPSVLANVGGEAELL